VLKKVYILGAGFSWSAGFPLAKDFFSFVSSHIQNSIDTRDIGNSGFFNELDDFTKKVEKHYQWILTDVELLCTYMDLAILSNSLGIFQGIFNSLDDLRLFRIKFSGAIVRAFRYKHDEFKISRRERTEKEKEANKLYWEFCEILEEGDTVISFNYDLLVEMGLWQQNKWTFLDGHGFKKDIEDFRSEITKIYSEDKPTKSKVRILKLHGSLGWFRKKFTDEIVFGEMPDSFEDYFGEFFEKGDPSPAVSYDEGSTLIEPSYIKQFDNPYLIDIWKQAINAIISANEIVIIGYSLPPADSASQLLLATSVRISNASKITVIDPCGDVHDKYKNVFQQDIQEEHVTFDNWMK
jgi:hypothetical protein